MTGVVCFMCGTSQGYCRCVSTPTPFHTKDTGTLETAGLWDKASVLSCASTNGAESLRLLGSSLNREGIQQKRWITKMREKASIKAFSSVAISPTLLPMDTTQFLSIILRLLFIFIYIFTHKCLQVGVDTESELNKQQFFANALHSPVSHMPTLLTASLSSFFFSSSFYPSEQFVL